MIHPKAKEEVEKLIDKIRREGARVKSVIVFGSATRKEGFRPGISDIDVAIVVEKLGDLSEDVLKDISEDLEIGVFTAGQFLELWLNGDPLAHMIWLEGIAVIDDGFYEALKARGRPKITEFTLMKLRFWGLKDLAKAMKPGVSRDKGLRGLHHAVRNFARLRIARDKDVFVITDDEVLKNLDTPLSMRYEDFLERLERNMEYYEQLILEAMDIMELLDGKPLPRLDEILSIAANEK
ncbi:MAG: nucleotidyltransferase domain-containing protein [Candidatus Nezhaarchaeales archaeon]